MRIARPGGRLVGREILFYLSYLKLLLQPPQNYSRLSVLLSNTHTFQLIRTLQECQIIIFWLREAGLERSICTFADGENTDTDGRSAFSTQSLLCQFRTTGQPLALAPVSFSTFWQNLTTRSNLTI